VGHTETRVVFMLRNIKRTYGFLNVYRWRVLFAFCRRWWIAEYLNSETACCLLIQLG